MITYEMITLEIPFHKYGRFKLSRAVCKGERPDIPNHVPEQYCNLIKDCWQQKPQLRPTFQEIVDRLNSEEFYSDLDIDIDRFKSYVDYIDNYKDSITESKLYRPKSKADKMRKEKKETKNDNDNDDEVLKNSSSINILDLNEFIKQKQLGTGRFSDVYRIEQKGTKKIFAAKISLQKISKEVSQNILSEVNIMKSLDHPAILKFIGYSPVDFDHQPKPTIVTEYAMNGSLQNVIDNVTKYPKWDKTKKLITIYGIVAGMSYLHEHSFLHNDLKPSNILLDENFYPKIADFGLSQTIANRKNDEGPAKSINIKGTPSYIAPEIWNEQDYNEATDMYSFGILLYELVYMKKTFAGMKPVQIGFKVTNNERPPFPWLKQSAFKQLIQRCWAQNPKNRPTFKELLVELQDNKYIDKNVDKNEYRKYIQFVQNNKQ